MHLRDSNILIYAGQPGNEFPDAWLTAEGARMSAISIPEVLGFTGLSAEDETVFEAWFARLFVQAVTEPILRRAAALRRQLQLHPVAPRGKSQHPNSHSSLVHRSYWRMC